jgi:hypothetical protein
MRTSSWRSTRSSHLLGTTLRLRRPEITLLTVPDHPPRLPHRLPPLPTPSATRHPFRPSTRVALLPGNDSSLPRLMLSFSLSLLHTSFPRHTAPSTRINSPSLLGSPLAFPPTNDLTFNTNEKRVNDDGSRPLKGVKRASDLYAGHGVTASPESSIRHRITSPIDPRACGDRGRQMMSLGKTRLPPLTLSTQR